MSLPARVGGVVLRSKVEQRREASVRFVHTADWQLGMTRRILGARPPKEARRAHG